MKNRMCFLATLLLFNSLAGAKATAPTQTSYTKTPTQFIQVSDVRYAYRATGAGGEAPLILLQHTRGTMDNWDPDLVDLLAQDRLVIAFDNRGISSSTGTTPDNFAAMAQDAIIFIHALGYKKVDLLGFSIGGAVAQEIMLKEPGLVRRAILAGTSAQGGEGVNDMSERSKAVSTKEKITDEDLLYGFFAPSEKSQKLGRAYLERIKRRQVDVEPPVTMPAVKAQGEARKLWGTPKKTPDERMKAVPIPVLIANGKNDIRMPTINSYRLFELFPKAQLILYPDSGHGFLFQYPELCGKNFNDFLNQKEISE